MEETRVYNKLWAFEIEECGQVTKLTIQADTEEEAEEIFKAIRERSNEVG